MPRTLYLHIGLPKTASTFLQERIFADLADRRTVLMPGNSYFRSTQAERFAKLLFERSATIWKYEADDLLAQLFGADWQGDNRDILFSDEAIGRSASRHDLFSAHLSGMAEALRSRGVERVKLLCLVRRQDHWLASHYAQMSDRTPQAGQADFESLVARVIDPRQERYTFGALLDYAAVHSACVDALGEENVSFCPMEWLSEPADTLRGVLAGFLDVDAETIDLADQRVNARRDEGRRWKVRPVQSRRMRMLETFKRRSSHIELTPVLCRQILETYRTSNLELGRRLVLDMDALGYFCDSSVAPGVKTSGLVGVAA